MAEPFRLRDANRLDVSEIAAIYRPEVESGLASWEEVAPGETEMASRMEKVQSAGLPYLVAERAGRVLGYAYAGPYHPRAAYRYTLENTVYVEPRSQGQGIGRALLEEVLRRCEAKGYRQMMALIHWTPGSPSIALHERLGFRLIGIAHGVGYKLDAWRDLALMQRPLGPGSATEPAPLAGTKDRLAVGH
jgi:phosphinothricin acetyltransferase